MRAEVFLPVVCIDDEAATRNRPFNALGMSSVAEDIFVGFLSINLFFSCFNKRKRATSFNVV